MRFLFIIGLMAAACGDDDGGTKECHGVGDAGAGATGATLMAGGTTFRYGGFTWGQNNDCPAQGSAVISVTITGAQVEPAGDLGMALCLPRPDLITDQPINLSDRSLVQVVGASGSSAGCVYAPAFNATPSGTVTFSGFCTTAGAKFTMTLAGSLPGTKTCGNAGPAENVTMTLGGTALVDPR